MTLKVDELIQLPPYSLGSVEKKKVFEEGLPNMVRHHYENCIEYRILLDLLEWRPFIKSDWESIPPLPVRVFKEKSLVSVDKRNIVKTLTSSGTSGGGISRIHLDVVNTRRQTSALARIAGEYIGTKRLPMLVIDQPIPFNKVEQLSARSAGVIGFSLFAKETVFALDHNMEINWPILYEFCERNKNKKVLVFGFTFIVWKKFIEKILSEGKELILEDGVLIHGGGWKKMMEDRVSNTTFKANVASATGILKVHNYYGMVEQTGSIFFECEKGYFHVPNVSDISVVNQKLNACQFGESGVIKLCSMLPTSYPGHIILTDDTGTIVGEDSCQCGRLGKYFVVEGRLPKVEVRGCSDA
ncbi:acyl-protein synthetase [Gammaproteobacteria bacterium]|nr:acyl-protein synthetase [Gammaproteobacteria bacterium]